ncbi:hypothetical protein [Paenibacillus sp. Marseille-Q4541]|uniref:hypothetical protein n=1 Tax=Paenibacillus sp. Marseille-Q4541 TaxID=2831522 RepID=UPI001BAB3758|nr:hypothetical protein [Paenibacillus sp. Marseille-Q4541]
MKVTSPLLTQLRDDLVFELETLIGFYSETESNNSNYEDAILGLKEALDVVHEKFDIYI